MLSWLSSTFSKLVISLVGFLTRQDLNSQSTIHFNFNAEFSSLLSHRGFLVQLQQSIKVEGDLNYFRTKVRQGR